MKRTLGSVKRMLGSGRRIFVAILAFVFCSIAATQLLSSQPSAVARTTTPDILIRPGIEYANAATSGPTSTSFCRKKYHISCYEPFQLQRAYNEGPLFDKGIDGKGQTIIIVDAFGSSTVAHDLGVFDKTFGLPAPPSLTIIQPVGTVPPGHAGWAGETDLDVEYSHVMAPDASILLVETPVNEDEGKTGFPEIIKAEKYVIDHHLGGVISQSFSATEQSFASAQQLLSLRGAYIDAAKNHITVLTASGDSGAADVGYDGRTYYPFPVTSWPDSDPLVTGIGGTQLHLNSSGAHTSPDSVWNDTYNVALNEFFDGNPGPAPFAGGGGKSVVFARPSYQDSVKTVVGQQRGVPDISMSGACDGGVDMYQSFPGEKPGWYVTCGTSEATPLFAGIIALVDQVAGHPVGLINPALYEMDASKANGIADVTSGNNTVTYHQDGKTVTVQGFNAVPGYDLASGVGTVNAANFVPQLAKAAG